MLSVSSTDQICVIIDVLGSPTPADTAFITDPDVLNFLRMLPEQTKRLNFAEKYPAAGKDAIDLLSRMLEFNPNKRLTVEQCLDHPFLASARNRSAEKKAPSPVTFGFENEGELSDVRLRELFAEELIHYKTLK